MERVYVANQGIPGNRMVAPAAPIGPRSVYGGPNVGMAGIGNPLPPMVQTAPVIIQQPAAMQPPASSTTVIVEERPQVSYATNSVAQSAALGAASAEGAMLGAEAAAGYAMPGDPYIPPAAPGMW